MDYLPHLSHCISASGKTFLLWLKLLDLAQLAKNEITPHNKSV